MGVSENQGKYFHFDNVFWNAPLKCGFLDLYQIGELCCECGFQVEEHEQSVHEITYVISGSGYSYIDGEKVRLEEGDVLVNSLGHRHAIRADESDLLRYTYIGFLFNEQAQAGEYDSLKAYYGDAPYSLVKDRNDILLPFMRCMDEFYSQMAYNRAMVSNYCQQIVILATRDSVEKREQPLPRSPYQNNVSSAVYAVLRYVEENLYSLRSIRELAEDLGYNYTYLSHFFREKTGVTLQNYIRYKKVERALQLMKYGELSVTQIAAQFHYESLQSFSKAFRRVMGFTPTKYMELERAKEEQEWKGVPQEQRRGREKGARAD
ncbi:MAG TPA: AraC family transcriptional regulator [Firmicutes bacterium]|nr:AraC family transcriptional regulator [Bacillota bacterium]